MTGRLYDLGPYPGAVLDGGPGGVVGEVLELPENGAVLRELDRYEGFDESDPERSLFVRRRVSVCLEDRREVSCWVYVYQRRLKNAVAIPHGDYRIWRHPPCPAPDEENENPS
jgi:gamma-glutamylcyclotransferase (GGCT)/AIG2-like uncharacterized protein YtfP